MKRRIRLLTVIGARPQIIKAAALSRAIAAADRDRIEELILHTGQHYDPEMSGVFFDELGVPPPAIDLGVGSAPHGQQTARMIEGIEREIIANAPDAVLVYGDTNSTLAAAIAASKLQVPLAHVEAGLRSWNKRMPEEINRILCDHCSTWLFCPTATALDNLEREGIPATGKGTTNADHPWVENCGDVMYDNSMYFAARAEERSTVLSRHDLRPQGYVLATMHRPQNTDDPTRLRSIMGTLLELYRRHQLPVVFPVHPRTRGSIVSAGSELRDQVNDHPGIRMIPPTGFLDMIALEKHARVVVTDSGGLQKEAYFFGVPCVILRAETEWVELVEHGQATLADADPERILNATERYVKAGAPPCPPIFGDGRAAEKILARLLGDLG